MTLIVLTHTLVPDTNENVSHVQQNLVDIRTVVNGQLGDDNLSATAAIAANKFATTVKEQTGLNDGVTARRGVCKVPGENSLSNVAYTALATPDQVTVTLPTDGFIVVMFEAMVKETVSGTTQAAIFLGLNQVKVHEPGGTLGLQEAFVGGGTTAGNYQMVHTTGAGLVGTDFEQVAGSPVTTGTIMGSVSTGAADNLAAMQAANTLYQSQGNQWSGGPCYISAVAGTHIVTIAYKCASGTLTAKERRLWVWTMGF